MLADSGKVEVYILDKTDMSYLPDMILKKLFEKIAEDKEPDRPHSWVKIEEIKTQMIQWEKFKV